MRCTSFLLLLACGDAWTGTHLTTPFVRPAARRGSSFGHFALTGGVNTAEDASESSLPPGVSARGRELCGMLGGVNVYLVGMMGSGKSSVGDTLAQRMGEYTLVDTDALIEKLTSSTCAELFETEGEPAFRDVEAAVLDQVHSFVRCVVATGGGAVTHMKNWGKMQTGVVAWLDVPVDELVARLGVPGEAGARPLLAGASNDAARAEKVAALLAERSRLYEQADVRVALGSVGGVDAAADAVVEKLIEYIKSNPPKSVSWKAKADEAAAAAQ